ncbi:MAG: HAMP domain-containing histidine kinase [Clostridia bacterium]|nr:HAMP domain-containing histidine kinase [Clostridia bacterium]
MKKLKFDKARYRDKAKARKEKNNLTFSLAFIVYIAFIATFALSALALMIFANTGIVDKNEGQIDASQAIMYMSLFIIVVGGIFSYVISRLALKPINKLINKINDLASGDFASRLIPNELIGRIPCFRDLTDTFNKLANELQNTELLRSDFINNFSHEFKTPIVSIYGFAKLLKKGNLTEDEREQYLSAIEEESMRLSAMATNVLNLTKIENTSLLYDLTEYNVSEQIRSCILLLENKWSKKNIDFNLDFDEYTVKANEELLKQVFINLLDNAIKFSLDNGTIDIFARCENDVFEFSITNYGYEISKEAQSKIFNKFYQGDESHSSMGNGIGLAIVKRIMDLHGGTIEVKSENKTVCFTLFLPI